MNKSKQLSEPATKGDLLDLEERLEKRFEKKFATKNDLQNGLQSLEARIDLKLDKLERRVDENVRGFRDDVFTKLDGIIKELEIAREDRTLALEETRATLDRIKNHEKRITKLEKLQQVT